MNADNHPPDSQATHNQRESTIDLEVRNKVYVHTLNSMKSIKKVRIPTVLKTIQIETEKKAILNKVASNSSR